MRVGCTGAEMDDLRDRLVNRRLDRASNKRFVHCNGAATANTAKGCQARQLLCQSLMHVECAFASSPHARIFLRHQHVTTLQHLRRVLGISAARSLGAAQHLNFNFSLHDWLRCTAVPRSYLPRRLGDETSHATELIFNLAGQGESQDLSGDHLNRTS